MKLVSFGLASVILAISALAASAQDAAKSLCAAEDARQALEAIKGRDIRPMVNADIITPIRRLPAGATVSLVVPRPLSPLVTPATTPPTRLFIIYRAVIQAENPRLLDSSTVGARALASDHELIKQKLAPAESTEVTFRVPDLLGSARSSATVYVYGCSATAEKLAFVSSLTLPLSTRAEANWIVWPVIIILYILLAIAVGLADRRSLDRAFEEARARRPGMDEAKVREETQIKPPPSLWRYFDPVVLCAGASGKASLSKLQILFFSVIVGGLVGHILLRIGTLTDLSETVLLLLGIAGVSAAAAKGVDVERFRLDFENYAWLIRKKWLPEGGLSSVNSARWRDIVISDGEFDVYRFQTVIFTVVVGGALLATGFNELATFEIPIVYLGVLGLSQVVYLGGKLVVPTGMKELNDGVKKLRELEIKFVEAVAKTASPVATLAAAIPTAKVEYDAYMEKANNVSIMFKSATGRDVEENKINPDFKV